MFLFLWRTIYKNNLEEHKESEDLYPTATVESKVEIEKTLKDLYVNANLRYITLRPTNVYGDFYNLNFNQGLIPNTIYKILKKEEVTIWGDSSSKSYLFAEDLAYVVCQMILRDDICGEFNVASSSVHSVLEVIKQIESKINIPAKISFQNKRSIDVSCNKLDTTKIKKIIEFKPHDLDYGLNKILKNINIKNE